MTASPWRFLQGGSGAGPQPLYSAAMDQEPASHFFTSQGIGIHYVDWGNAAAPPLLLIHGTRDHARSWDWAARALAAKFHVVALDLRGHGDSGWSEDGAYLLPYHLLDILEMIEILGPAPLDVIGHSFGGNAVARLAGIYPERIRKIVFVDSLGPTPANYAQWEREGAVARTRDWLAQRRDPGQMRKRHFATVEEGAARMAKSNPRLTPEQAYHLAKHGLRQEAEGLSWKFDPRVSLFAPEDFAVPGPLYWREITAPALILSGDQSWMADPMEDGRAAIFRQAQCVRVRDAGHWLHHDQLATFLSLVEAFLA